MSCPLCTQTEITETVKVFIPTREFIESLQVGSIVLNMYGKELPITDLFAKKEDINGKMFACFYQEFGENGKMSSSMKEGELFRTWEIYQKFNSVQIDEIETCENNLKNDTATYKELIARG